MVSNYQDACRALGIRPGATREQWKTAYRNICKMYHPDNYMGQDGIIILQNACDAYDFLEKQYTVISSRGPKVIGTPVKNNGSAENNILRQQLKAQEEKRKLMKQKELQERASQIRQQQQKEKQEKILDEIRWIRVAEIIRNTIREDEERKNLEKKMYEALENAQNNNR